MVIRCADTLFELGYTPYMDALTETSTTLWRNITFMRDTPEEWAPKHILWVHGDGPHQVWKAGEQQHVTRK